MQRRLLIVIAVTVMFLIGTAGLTFAGDWMLDSNSGKLPADLETLVKQAGGTLVKTMDEVGVAVAEFATREEAEAMEAYGFTVMPDVSLNWLPSGQNAQAVEHIGSDEPFYPYQWHLPVIQADMAWNEGVTGSNVRVAVLDTGIWYYHPDLYYNIDFASSASFVPGSPDFLDVHGHGTHVSGIIAAADNGWGVIGVAPNATLIGVKVLGDNGSGSISWIVQGVIHAIQQDADIINMSLGGYLKKNGAEGLYTANEAAAIANMYRKVFNWAKSQGSLVVVSAGNDSEDMDDYGTIIVTPAECGAHVVVSATGPTGLQDFDTLASYSNYGNSLINIAAPGGDFRLYPQPGWYYDMVLSCGPSVPGDPYYHFTFMAGTSQAAPVVSGVAALILSKYGPMTAAKLRNHLYQTADDIFKPGQDEFSGKGRVNAYKAVTK